MLLDIAEVSQRSGLAPSALRFYERKGLITPDGRNGLRLRLPGGDARAGSPSSPAPATPASPWRQIAAFLRAGPSDTVLRERMAAKEREVSERVDQLTRLRDSLRHAAVCEARPAGGMSRVQAGDPARAVRGRAPVAIRAARAVRAVRDWA